MNTTLNMTTLDGGIIKRGEGGGSTPSPDTPSKPKYTGHTEAEKIGYEEEQEAERLRLEENEQLDNMVAQ